MKKISSFLFLSLLLASCQEWQPVMTLTYPDPEAREPLMLDVNTSIAQLKQMYLDNGSQGLEITSHVCIGGQVVSSDRSGNIYRDLYIQDATGAICVKVGKSSLYSDYHLGQWVYVDCAGLRLGAYNGMPQLGIEDESGKNDTAYIDAQYLIDTHIFRGRIGTLPEPRVVSAAELQKALDDGGFKSDLWGAYVQLNGLTYGAKSDYSTDKYKRIFAILYAGDNPEDRVFLSDKTYGITSWAMSKSKVSHLIFEGRFDEAKTQDGRPVRDAVLDGLLANASPVTMSQYFSLGTVPVQIRTSGYSKFADTDIPAVVIGDPDSSTADGRAIDVTGLLSIYNGAAQFTLIDLDGVRLTKTN